ncbi:ABC transporter permease [Streptomyces goshikiensis]|uniref:ABC transporter permease n=1 Tax=Streptomyces TaxID=1883 RepID=UPI000F3A95F5|nr:ABC transporter permease [Streptomyces sp. ADI95-16]AYV32449.1 ABC-2 type transporter [Streptomyces sp. ADI95-16]
MTAYASNGFASRRSRMLALGHTELIMLLRNRSALVSALVLPLGSLWFIHSVTPSTFTARDDEQLLAGPVLATGTIGMVLLFVVYSTLVGAYVARREGLVLKRLRTGSLSDSEILVGTAMPVAGVAWAQCGIVLGVGVALLDVQSPASSPLLLIGVVIGTVLVAALAACSAVFTRTVEMAQLTTMPLILVSVAGSGLVMPLEALPSWATEVCRVLPLTPVMELVRLGWLGTDDGTAVWSAALPQLGGALLWTAAAVWVARTWFRWEPRK